MKLILAAVKTPEYLGGRVSRLLPRYILGHCPRKPAVTSCLNRDMGVITINLPRYIQIGNHLGMLPPVIGIDSGQLGCKVDVVAVDF